MPKYPKPKPDPHKWEELETVRSNGGHIRLRCKKCKKVGFKDIETGIIKTFAERCEK